MVKDVTLTKSVKTTYNATTGAHSQTTTTATGLAMEATERAIQDNFPAYVAGPTDRPFYLQGLTTAPAENDTITIGSETLTVKTRCRHCGGWRPLLRGGCLMHVVEFKPVVDQGAVDVLERTLSLAKAGELKDVVVLGEQERAGVYHLELSFDDKWRALGALAWASVTISAAGGDE